MTMDYVNHHWLLIAGLIVLLGIIIFHQLILRLFGVIVVPDNSVGVSTKKFVLVGRNRRLPDGKIIALHGEAGFQADTLAPGLHMGLWPWQYQMRSSAVPHRAARQGGLRRGLRRQAADERPHRAREVDCDSFQDARAFLENGGERGPQMAADSRPAPTASIPFCFKSVSATR